MGAVSACALVSPSLVEQEFLAEMLDALHEDVNRVIEKPYVPAPEESEAESGKSNQDLADEAWNRHVQRNRSVIVDLFQGQLKMECRCPVCNKKVRVHQHAIYYCTTVATTRYCTTVATIIVHSGSNYCTTVPTLRTDAENMLALRSCLLCGRFLRL